MTPRALMIVTAYGLGFSAAYADIGAVGPSVPDALSPPAQGNAAAQSPAANNPAEAPPRLFMVIDVDRRYDWHARYERALRSAVQNNESVHPGSYYTVLSIVPWEQAGRRMADANANLQIVVQTLESLGISQTHITSNTQAADTGNRQEIQIFVH